MHPYMHACVCVCIGVLLLINRYAAFFQFTFEENGQFQCEKSCEECSGFEIHQAKSPFLVERTVSLPNILQTV